MNGPRVVCFACRKAITIARALRGPPMCQDCADFADGREGRRARKESRERRREEEHRKLDRLKRGVW